MRFYGSTSARVVPNPFRYLEIDEETGKIRAKHWFGDQFELPLAELGQVEFKREPGFFGITFGTGNIRVTSNGSDFVVSNLMRGLECKKQIDALKSRTREASKPTLLSDMDPEEASNLKSKADVILKEVSRLRSELPEECVESLEVVMAGTSIEGLRCHLVKDGRALSLRDHPYTYEAMDEQYEHFFGVARIAKIEEAKRWLRRQQVVSLCLSVAHLRRLDLPEIRANKGWLAGRVLSAGRWERAFLLESTPLEKAFVEAPFFVLRLAPPKAGLMLVPLSWHNVNEIDKQFVLEDSSTVCLRKALADHLRKRALLPLFSRLASPVHAAVLYALLTRLGLTEHAASEA